MPVSDEVRQAIEICRQPVNWRTDDEWKRLHDARRILVDAYLAIMTDAAVKERRGLCQIIGLELENTGMAELSRQDAYRVIDALEKLQ